MAKLRIDGIDELIDHFSKIERKGFISIDSLQNGADELKKGIQNDTPKKTGTASECVEVQNKIDKKTLKVVDVGFDSTFGDSDWEKWKGVWYNHWGFNLHMYGCPTERYVDKHKGWFDKSVKKNKAKVERQLMSDLEKEIEKLL